MCFGLGSGVWGWHAYLRATMPHLSYSITNVTLRSKLNKLTDIAYRNMAVIRPGLIQKFLHRCRARDRSISICQNVNLAPIIEGINRTEKIFICDPRYVFCFVLFCCPARIFIYRNSLLKQETGSWK